MLIYRVYTRYARVIIYEGVFYKVFYRVFQMYSKMCIWDM